MSEHWAQRRWADLTAFEKVKVAALWTVCIGGALLVIVAVFFLKSYRWGSCP